MGLITQGPAFARWSENLGTVSADGIANVGVAVTPGTSNADGSAVTLLSALAHDCEYLVLAVYGFGESAVCSSSLLDLLIDPAGGTSWSTHISDLICGYTSFLDLDAGAALGTPLMYHFPIWLKAGTSIGALARTFKQSAFTNTPRVVAFAAGGNKNPASWWCGQKVETVGTFDAANSRGQDHTAGASGAFSSWTSLGSPIGARSGAMQFGCGGEATTASPNPDSGSTTGRVYRFEFGAGSNQIGPCMYRGMGGLEVGTHFFPGPVFCDIPSGTQMQVRAACGGTGPEILDVGLYLVQ
jgi:hypothetical protein